MLYIHPIIQVAATFLALLVLRLGLARFGSLHLGKTWRFNRKLHARLGALVLCSWLAGIGLGLVLVRYQWYRWLVTGIHAYLGLIAIPLILFGLLSGIYLYNSPKKRTTLPLLHGLCNAIMLLLALVQIYFGWQVVRYFLRAE